MKLTKRLLTWRGIQKIAAKGNYEIFKKAYKLNYSWDTCLVGEHIKRNGTKVIDDGLGFSDKLKIGVKLILHEKFYPSISKEDPKLLLSAIRDIEKFKSVFR